MFSQYGEIVSVDLIDSRSIIFITFSDAHSAWKAVEDFQNKDTQFRKGISEICLARNQDKVSECSSILNDYSEEFLMKCNVIFKYLDPIMTEEELKLIASSYGVVLSCSIAKDDYGYSKRYGFVLFSSQEEALAVIKQFFAGYPGLPGSDIVAALWQPRYLRHKARISRNLINNNY